MTLTAPRAKHRTTVSGFPCPFCLCTIQAGDRLSYPRELVPLYEPVYRCRSCGKHVGKPIGIVMQKARCNLVECEDT